MGTVTMQVLNSREEWLQNRKKGLGGSEIAAVIGQSPWFSNTELWEYKTGRKERPDLSGNEAVQYGQLAEAFLRELFALDHPDLKVGYVENNSFTNTAYPWAVASLDGWLTDKDGRRGILEIKTTSKAWPNDSIPNHYYCQVLFYMAVYEADFAVLKCQQRWVDDTAGVKAFTKHYHIERSEVQEDIDYLMEKGATYWREYIVKDKRPALVITLPGL